ncbi:MATE family efflux transporter [Anaerotignum lactatifermentans]|uniref:MATE family efflux transporter n=1 Tax=Anaerotignum lactatifermentans TaxID=160404 RepID=A0ABS2G922_9FIRM|nr:MATE family efflux transporter [Anaerotignum lactatifermentans]MBM6828564.1 MATE family efflux transporter [Anaerotignum lactatifermentans]MBM6877971.1 MATE family efflux transporter [Anaerotignum lactatifermentans]MBM6950146.1 MATE family efflux transporter [Anaerotignum lactatifermentans]
MEENSFLEGKILPSLIKFAIPLMLSLVLQALYSGVDLMVVGKFGSTASISAVSTGGQVMQSATVIITGLTMGVTVLLGQAIGAGKQEETAAIVAGQIRLLIVVSLFLTGLLVYFAEDAARLVHVPEKALPEAVSYIRICASGMIFITAYNAVSGIFRGMGDSRSPFLFVLIACIINIILDLIFVGIFHLSAAGAAMATVSAQGCSFLFALLYMTAIKDRLPFRMTKDSFRQKGSIRRILAMGVPIAAQDFQVNISFLIITAIINTLGLVESASVGIAEKLFIFLALVPMSFMSALSAFVAQNVGAGKTERATKAFFAAVRISFSCGFLVFLLTFLQGDLLASIFTSDPQVIASTQLYLKSCSFEYLFTAVNFCLLGYFNGRGKTRFVLIQGILTVFAVRIPLSYCLRMMPGTSLMLIGVAVPLSALFELLVCAWYFRRLQKNTSSCEI